MDYSINFSEEKNLLLKESRGICFDDAIDALEQGKLLGRIKHPNPSKYPNQAILLVEIGGHVYVVPYITNEARGEIYLKTVFPSRKFTKLYRKEK